MRIRARYIFLVGSMLSPRGCTPLFRSSSQGLSIYRGLGRSASSSGKKTLSLIGSSDVVGAPIGRATGSSIFANQSPGLYFFTSSAIIKDSHSPLYSETLQHMLGSIRLDAIQVKEYLGHSMGNFGNVRDRIYDSVINRRFIYLEDGESDDHMQTGMAYMAGHAPSSIYLRGGYFKLRKEVTTKIGGALTGDDPNAIYPRILTMHGDSEHFSMHDKIEGTGILSDDARAQLIHESLVDGEGYKTALKEADEDFIDTLQRNEFTTIVLKGAPSRMVDLIEKVENYQNKVAILWLGPVAKRPEGGFTAKFNYNQDLQASDKLVSMNIPKIIISPNLGNAHMRVIVDKAFNDIYKARNPPHRVTDFEGYERVSQLEHAKGVTARTFTSAAKAFQDTMIKGAEDSRDALNVAERELKTQLKQTESIKNLIKKEAQRATLQQKLLTLADEKATALGLGTIWGNVQEDAKLNGMKERFYEFCALDQFANVVLDRTIGRGSIKEVLAVDIQRTPLKGRYNVDVKPNPSSQTFIISHVDSSGLQSRIQNYIDWMVEGENPVPIMKTTSKQ